MSLWERVMLHFFPKHHPAPEASKKVDAAFERMVCARIQVGEVAGEVAQTARAHQQRVQVERLKIRERTAETAAKYPTGRTTEMRALVEEVLMHPGLRGENEKKGRP